MQCVDGLLYCCFEVGPTLCSLQCRSCVCFDGCYVPHNVETNDYNSKCL